jgi:hypothetical protein
VTIFLFPFCALAILPALQSRIVALAGSAPDLAAASIHAAFNRRQRDRPWLGGITIAAGLGYGAPTSSPQDWPHSAWASRRSQADRNSVPPSPAPAAGSLKASEGR